MHTTQEERGANNDSRRAPVVFEDILSAAELIRSHARRTSIVTSKSVNEATNADVYIKPENFQRTGAFKFRGAFNALSRLTKDQRQAGVLTYSSGNHAQAIALSGTLLGIETTIVMPNDAPAIKLRATKAYGAEVITYDKHSVVREELAGKIAAERGMTIIPPYDHPHVVAGQGTVALELLSDVADLDYVFVPCGGAGLLSGSAIAAKALQPSCKVIGVEPAAGDDATRSAGSKGAEPGMEWLVDGDRRCRA